MRRLLGGLSLAGWLFFAGCDERPSAADRKAQALAVVREYVGRDFSEPSDEETRPLRDAVRLLDPTVPEQDIFGPAPRYVWEFGREGEPPGYLVVQTSRYLSHPGFTQIYLLATDATGEVRAKSEFTTGWRRYLKTASLSPDVGGGYPVIVLECRENLGPHVGRDYYALIGRQFDLIRAEDQDGRAVRNAYYVNHFTRGPKPVVQGATQWESDLLCHDRARTLRVLVWLGGRHALPPRPGDRVSDQEEDESDAELVRRVRARPGVVARLKELAANGSAWEREAARLARKPEDVKRWPANLPPAGN